jgi:CheY-like chemotaxis protein
MIDDDLASIEFTRAVLKTFGLELNAVRDKETFLAEFRAHPPELCFVDLCIGELDFGFSLIQELRVMNSRVPIFVVSGFSDSKSIAHAMEVGATDFIVKPLDPEILASKLMRYLDNEKLVHSRLSYFPVPHAVANATVSLDFEVHSVDLFGFTLVGSYLLPKGTVFFLEGPLVSEVLGVASHYFFVTSTWALASGQGFAAYIEFSPSKNKTNIDKLHAWLASKTVKQVAE